MTAASISARLLDVILLSSNFPHRELSAILGSCESSIKASLPKLIFLSEAIVRDFRTDFGKSNALVFGDRYGEEGASNFFRRMTGDCSPNSGSVPLTCDDTDDASGISVSSSAFPI